MASPIDPTTLSDKPKIPNAIIEIVNNLITQNWEGFKAIVYQDDIIKAYLKHPEASVKTRDQVFEKHFLDFEDIYRSIGWSVRYESPDRDEDFKSYFKFTKA